MSAKYSFNSSSIKLTFSIRKVSKSKLAYSAGSMKCVNNARTSRADSNVSLKSLSCSLLCFFDIVLFCFEKYVRLRISNLHHLHIPLIRQIPRNNPLILRIIWIRFYTLKKVFHAKPIYFSLSPTSEIRQLSYKTSAFSPSS